MSNLEWWWIKFEMRNMTTARRRNNNFSQKRMNTNKLLSKTKLKNQKLTEKTRIWFLSCTCSFEMNQLISACFPAFDISHMFGFWLSLLVHCNVFVLCNWSNVHLACSLSRGLFNIYRKRSTKTAEILMYFLVPFFGKYPVETELEKEGLFKFPVAGRFRIEIAILSISQQFHTFSTLHVIREKFKWNTFFTKKHS